MITFIYTLIAFAAFQTFASATLGQFDFWNKETVSVQSEYFIIAVNFQEIKQNIYLSYDIIDALNYELKH